jgi:hypothetical protein
MGTSYDDWRDAWTGDDDADTRAVATVDADTGRVVAPFHPDEADADTALVVLPDNGTRRGGRELTDWRPDGAGGFTRDEGGDRD